MNEGVIKKVFALCAFDLSSTSQQKSVTFVTGVIAERRSWCIISVRSPFHSFVAFKTIKDFM
jgi:hypothetical protein